MELVDLLGSGLSDNITDFYNNTNDARLCYTKGRVEVCVRISLLLVLTIVTGVLCIVRIVQYHCYKAKTLHQYIIYYVAVLMCLLSIVHWAYVSITVLDFINTYLILVQILVISHFFCSWAFRLLLQEKVFRYVVFPVLIGILAYFTGALIWAGATLRDVQHECTSPQWLLFSSSQLVLVQFFLLTVIYIQRKLNDVRTMRTNRLSQKAQLWGLAIVYEVVAVIIFIYDLYLLITNEHDCGHAITHDNIGMTVIYVIHKTVKYLLPQWAMFVIFSPLKPRPQDREGEMEETDTFSWVEKPNYKSTFYHTPTSGESDESSEKLAPFSINGSSHQTGGNYPILPRSTNSATSYQSSPWLKSLPGQNTGYMPKTWTTSPPANVRKQTTHS